MAPAIPPVVVRLTVALSAPSSRAAQELLEALRFLGVGARLEPGCIACSSWIDPDATVRHLEEWANEADLRRRVRSDPFTSLLAVVESAQGPNVRFDFVSESRGIDYVAEVRGAAAGDHA